MSHILLHIIIYRIIIIYIYKSNLVLLGFEHSTAEYRNAGSLLAPVLAQKLVFFCESVTKVQLFISLI